MTDTTKLAPEAAPESGSILIIVAARLTRRECFTPLHTLCELPQRVISTRTLREAVERAEELLQREVGKIVDGHRRLTRELKVAEAELGAKDKRIAGLLGTTVITVPGKFEIFTQAGGVTVAVKDGVTKNHLYGMGWNACREAMLQDDNPSVIQDNWIKCSERMPEKLIPVMVMYEDGEMWSAIWSGQFWDDGGAIPDPHSITHWQPMPAAPQQEVNNANGPQ